MSGTSGSYNIGAGLDCGATHFQSIAPSATQITGNNNWVKVNLPSVLLPGGATYTLSATVRTLVTISGTGSVNVIARLFDELSGQTVPASEITAHQVLTSSSGGGSTNTATINTFYTPEADARIVLQVKRQLSSGVNVSSSGIYSDENGRTLINAVRIDPICGDSGSDGAVGPEAMAVQAYMDIL